MTRLLPILVACLAIFHSPDGKEVRIDTKHVVAVRPAEAVKQHLAPGTNAIIYATTQTFGVVETTAEVQTILSECVEE